MRKMTVSLATLGLAALGIAIPATATGAMTRAPSSGATRTRPRPS